MKVNYRKVSKEYTEHARSSDYDKSASLEARLTRFVSSNLVSGGRNGQNTLVDLQTRVIEADGLYIETSPRSSLVAVYLSSRVRRQSGDCSTETMEGSRSRQGVLIRYKTPKGKYDSRCLFADSDSMIDTLKAIFGYDIGPKVNAEGYQWFLENQTDNVVDLQGNEVKVEPTEEHAREYTYTLYREVLSDLNYRESSETLERIAKALGFTIVKVFPFVEKFWFSPEYVNETASSIEFGWMTNATYNSLPVTLSIRKVTETKTVRLADLGIEGRGYYDHYDKFSVLPEHVEAAKEFASKFERSKRRMMTRILKEVA